MGLCHRAHVVTGGGGGSRGSGVCNWIGGYDGDSCGSKGLRRGLGQMEKSWARGLCSFIILEAALLGCWDPHSSIESPAPSATNTACPCMLSHMWGGSQGSSIHHTGRLWKKGGFVNPSPPPHSLVVWSWASLVTSVSTSSLVEWKPHDTLNKGSTRFRKDSVASCTVVWYV